MTEDLRSRVQQSLAEARAHRPPESHAAVSDGVRPGIVNRYNQRAMGSDLES